MAKTLEEAQEKYRVADKELLAAREAFEEAPWRNRDLRMKTWKRLEAAEAAYHVAMTEFTPWVTGDNKPYTGDIKIVE
jgi:hypothetical protein